VPVEKAVSKLVLHLQRDESKDVRIACADALRNTKTQEVARALIGVLNDRDFGVAWQARQSLRLMTGHDYRYDDNAWVQYLAAEKNPFT
jgi:HEAT repeat protein